MNIRMVQKIRMIQVLQNKVYIEKSSYYLCPHLLRYPLFLSFLESTCINCCCATSLVA